MDEPYHAIIMAALTGKADHAKVATCLYSDASREAYNRCVLELLQQRDSPPSFSYNPEQILASDVSDLRKPYVSHHAQITKEFLQDFYQIESCPSFLYHDAVLVREDLDFLLEIYSQAHGVRYSEECGKYMQESLVKYARAIVRACKEGGEQLLRDASE